MAGNDSTVVEMRGRKIVELRPKPAEASRGGAWTDGALRAVDMIEAIEEGDQGSMSLEPEWRSGPQKDVVGDFLADPRLQSDAAYRAGFTAMLTHAIAGHVHGGPACVGWLECLAQAPAADAQAEWQRRNRETASD